MGLHHLGIDSTAEAVYQQLLAEPHADASRLAAALGCSQERVDEAIETLCERALVTRDGTEGGCVRLLDPDLALNALVAVHEAEVLTRERALREARHDVARLLATRSVDSALPSAPGIEHVVGYEAVRRRLDRMARECREEVWSFNPGDGTTQESLRGAQEANEESLSRGIRMRALYLDSIRNVPYALKHAAWMAERGAEIRTVPSLPTRMIIVDRERVVLPLQPGVSGMGANIVTSPGVVQGMVSLFAATWREATPLGAKRPPRVQGLSAQERTAVHRWAQGATDAAVARSLGVSERTVRRISDNLAARLGVSSRFQFGAQCVLNGWLSADDFI